ncbi:hypothetical protein [Arachidicoccus rhizosphaerae]|nr:hypothetical protein [Arachidicoccus rhizosphaerae]
MQAEKELIAQLTGKAGLADTPPGHWEALTRQYPAFNLGYYFLSKAQPPAGTDSKSKQEALQKSRQAAALHFNDIRWLDYLLQSDRVEKPEVGAIPATAKSEPAPPIKTGTIQQPNQQSGLSAEVAATGSATAATGEEGLTIEPAEKAAAAPVASNAQADTQGSEAAADTHTDTELASDSDNGRLSQVLSQQLAAFKKPVSSDARLEVERDPLYKTDYFASQGIAVLKSLEGDGLGKKVRKFTDWLKEMKQSPTNAGVPQLNTTPEEEAQAAQKAASSLKNEPIFTESMAEVLVSQGKTEQARDVYQKLSLLYPEKSTYFASKIDLLQ